MHVFSPQEDTKGTTIFRETYPADLMKMGTLRAFGTGKQGYWDSGADYGVGRVKKDSKARRIRLKG